MNTLRFKTLEQWLAWQTTLHPRKIDLGLSRCRTVAQRLQLLPSPFRVINVAGTNGKGSSVVLLDSLLSAAGYRVGRYTSPHLLRYNERICVAGQEATTAQLLQAFNLIEEARGDITLTFFEFGTLAALCIFQQSDIDLAVLEVGLGGRLDAVNIVDPDIALVTAIDIDHVDWLGPDRESIGFEKAGIFRAQRPAVCSDPQPPQRLIQYAEQLQAPLYYLGRDFTFFKHSDNTWSWELLKQPSGRSQSHSSYLPLPALPGHFQLQNAAGVLMVLDLLSQTFPLSKSALHQGLINATWQGRFQIFPGKITRILDVAHNPLGARVLKELLQQYDCQGETHAVVGMLATKNIADVVAIMHESITHWHVAAVNSPHSATVPDLLEHLKAIGVIHAQSYPSITAAYTSSLAQAQAGDRIIVYGSFYTVSEVLALEMA